MRKRDWRIADALCPLVLGTLRRAEYSVSEDGHFGLAVLHYLHFTSPIRRYPDLLAHRAMRAAMRGEPEYRPTQAWETIGEHCTATEHAADKLSWRVKSPPCLPRRARSRGRSFRCVYQRRDFFRGFFCSRPICCSKGSPAFPIFPATTDSTKKKRNSSPPAAGAFCIWGSGCPPAL